MKAKILIFFTTLFYGQQEILPKVSIHDRNIIQSLEKYIRHVENEGWDKPHKQQILLRIDSVDNDQIAYFDCASSLSSFIKDTPDCYSLFNGRTVFIYTTKKDLISNDSVHFRNFYDQFENILEKDIDKDGNHNPEFRQGILHHIDKWRVAYSANGQIRIKKVPLFPSHKFYEDYRYDSHGYLTFRDGVFTSAAVTPHQWEPENFNLRNYIVQHTSISEDILREGGLNAIMVIDEEGKVIDSAIEGSLNESLVIEIQDALRKMPAWHPGKIEGKSVKVRIRQRL